MILDRPGHLQFTLTVHQWVTQRTGCAYHNYEAGEEELHRVVPPVERHQPHRADFYISMPKDLTQSIA